jgi:CO/xanthine dehydrogenase FAD-binding subunit
VFDLKVLHRPESPEEAIRLFAETDGTGLYVGGGTVVVPAGSPKLSFLVDLSRVGLDYVRQDGGLTLGATLTVADLARSREASGPASGLLRTAAMAVANHTVRNLATVGGNVAAWPYPTDLPAALLALNASLVIQSAAGRREQALHEFLGKKGDAFERGDLIVEIAVPEPPPGLVGGFEKIGRKRLDVSIVNAAAALTLRGGTMTDARVALGGGGVTPSRVAECEKLLEGSPVSEETLAEAGRVAQLSYSPRGDHRAGADYRKNVSAVAVKRALMRAVGLLPPAGFDAAGA